MATGIRGTYTDTTIAKRSIIDAIDMLAFKEAPLLKLFGLNNQTKFRLLNWPRTKYEWLTDTMSPVATTINDSGGISDSDTSLIVTDSTIFKEGDIIQIDSEQMYVSAVNTTTHTLTITRNFNSAGAATHADTTAVYLRFPARLEAADYDLGHTTVTANPYNYTQIFSEAVSVSGSEAVNQEYGIDDQMAYQLAKLWTNGGSAGKIPQLIENTFYYGARNQGSASTPRSMGGFTTFVTTNTNDLSGAVLTMEPIHDMVQAIVLAGGNPDTLLCSMFVQRKLTSMYEDKYWTTRTEDIGGPVSIRTLHTDFADLDVIWDRRCPTDYMYILQKEKMGWITYRPFEIKDYETSGDYFVKEVIGELGFVLLTEGAHGYIYNFDTTR